ncbi:hypothetical protein M0813_06410 [Anaeramoeba flamelloides]|uniref:Uncharacterized protein n=1 Tax=Anaeramoeba flamelloides TaxID=1746091 RepID=A0ABQ8XDX2_9EUKA|nr:hypothetical protein M0813_06410 [Anaeramoeba flamelloides]
MSHLKQENQMTESTSSLKDNKDDKKNLFKDEFYKLKGENIAKYLVSLGSQKNKTFDSADWFIKKENEKKKKKQKKKQSENVIKTQNNLSHENKSFQLKQNSYRFKQPIPFKRKKSNLSFNKTD